MGIDRRDACACNLGPHHHGVRHALGGEIGDIDAMARHQTIILDASLILAPLAQWQHSRCVAVIDRTILPL